MNSLSYSPNLFGAVSSWVVVGGQENSVSRGLLQLPSPKLGSERLPFSRLEFSPGRDAREEHVRPFGWAHTQLISHTDIDQPQWQKQQVRAGPICCLECVVQVNPLSCTIQMISLLTSTYGTNSSQFPPRTFLRVEPAGLYVALSGMTVYFLHTWLFSLEHQACKSGGLLPGVLDLCHFSLILFGYTSPVFQTLLGPSLLWCPPDISRLTFLSSYFLCFSTGSSRSLHWLHWVHFLFLSTDTLFLLQYKWLSERCSHPSPTSPFIVRINWDNVCKHQARCKYLCKLAIIM